jgi:hypothetical protein
LGQNWGSKHTYCAGGHRVASPLNSGLRAGGTGIAPAPCGFWSLLPFVQRRSGTCTKGLKVGHFGHPKCQDVHQRSAALESTVGSSQPGVIPRCLWINPGDQVKAIRWRDRHDASNSWRRHTCHTILCLHLAFVRRTGAPISMMLLSSYLCARLTIYPSNASSGYTAVEVAMRLAMYDTRG